MSIKFKFLKSLFLFFMIVIHVEAGIRKNDPSQQLKVVYITSGNWGDIFDLQAKESMRKRGYDLEPMYRLKEAARQEGYDLRIAKRDAYSLVENNGISAKKDFLCVIAFDVYGNQLRFLKKYPSEKLILFLWEPPSVSKNDYQEAKHKIFSKVYTWNDDLVDNQKYFKIHYPVLHEMVVNPIPFDHRKLAALVSTPRSSTHPDELYTEREKVVEYYENQPGEDFDLYGKGWDSGLKVYRGMADNKFEVLQNHKFYYCYENMKGITGYITEKIFDCFEAGCVPIYWGASNIQEYIPANCYIDRRKFRNNEELHAFISMMDESTHATYLENIKNYIASERAHRFSYDHFVETVMALIRSCDAD